MYLTGILVATLFAVAHGGVTGSPTAEIHKALAAKDAQALQNSPASGSTPASKDLPLVPNNSQSNVMSSGDSVIQMSRFCFFGKFPSATCRFRCHLMDKDAYCEGAETDHEQSGEGKCVCQAKPVLPAEEGAQDLFAKPETHKEQEEEKAKKPGEGKKPQELEFTIPLHTAPQESEEDQGKHHVVFYVFDLNKIFGPQANGTKPEAGQGEVPGPQAAPAGWAFQHLLALLIIFLLFVLIALEIYACYRKQRAKNGDMETIFKNIPMPNKA